MHFKTIYRAALVSSPIMVAFELSPLFFIVDHPIDYSRIILGVVMLLIITLLQWTFNIYLYYIHETRRNVRKWKTLLLSYLFAFLLIATAILLSKLLSTSEKPESASIAFPFINAATLNTIILIIITSIVNRSKREQTDRELALLKIKNLEAEQEQLIQRLQPHFLFNALSTLKSLINSDPEQAEEYLIRLSDFLRFTVSTHVSKLVTLDKELAFTKDYIKLQQIRFADSILCKIHIPDTALQNFSVPIYALQTLVENALKHNIFTSAKPLHLNITFDGGSIEVKNNKMPKPNDEQSGMGLENLNKRFLLIGGEAITIKDRDDSFTVRIKLIDV
ncbi:MAG: sensor histidine kinase [Bacteroidales bacterium]